MHGSADLQAALARAAGTEGEGGKERGAEAGETFWSLDLPGTVLQPDVRARVSRVQKLKGQSVTTALCKITFFYLSVHFEAVL